MTKSRNKQNTWHGLRNVHIPVLVACVLLILVFYMLFHLNNEKKPMVLKKWSQEEEELIRSHPSMEVISGREVVWEVPEFPKAVLFIAHGCNGRATNFWDGSIYCPKCIGLPEERLLVLHALAHKFAVLVVSSAGKCWTFGEEMLVVERIITQWVRKTKLESLPLVSLGASSGGYFVSALATRLRFSSVVLMISEGLFDQIKISSSYPPALFVHMPKDATRKQKIARFVEMLKKRGIDVAEVECSEFPLSPTFLAHRIPKLDETMAARLCDELHHNGFVDQNGYMMKDGRATPWREAVMESRNILIHKNLFGHLEEELNLAYGYHEMSSLQSEQIFQWFLSHMQ